MLAPAPASLSTLRTGILFGLGAYGLWGLIPLYFRSVGHVPPLEVLAHRVVWSCVVLGLLATWRRRWPELFRAATSRVGWALGLSAVLIGINWLTYIVAVDRRDVLQASLGYFITPLANVALGVLVLRERLRPWQGVALALALGAVGLRAASAAGFPWIALTLAASFSLYGLVRKLAAIDGIVGLLFETIALVPLGLAYGAWLSAAGASHFGPSDLATSGLLAAGGVVTTVPLVCFVEAARRLPMSLLGFLQYLAPSLQFLVAAVLLGERVTRVDLVSFGLIALAVATYSVDSYRAWNGGRAARGA